MNIRAHISWLCECGQQMSFIDFPDEPRRRMLCHNSKCPHHNKVVREPVFQVEAVDHAP